MGGKWESFNEVVTTTEFLTIPQPDQGALKYAMERYGKGQNVGWVLKNYGDGLMMLKAKNRSAGRCLFFMISETDPARFVALLFYKKESDEAPAHIMETARQRMATFKAGG